MEIWHHDVWCRIMSRLGSNPGLVYASPQTFCERRFCEKNVCSLKLAKNSCFKKYSGLIISCIFTLFHHYYRDRVISDITFMSVNSAEVLPLPLQEVGRKLKEVLGVDTLAEIRSHIFRRTTNYQTYFIMHDLLLSTKKHYCLLEQLFDTHTYKYTRGNILLKLRININDNLHVSLLSTML